MSTLKTNNVQVGQSVTATNNFTLYQPASPDGTVRLGVGNSGATTADVVTANSSGNVGIGTSSPAYRLQIAAAPATSANFVGQFIARTSGADANVGDYAQFGGSGDSGYFGRRYNATIGWMAAIGGTNAVAFNTGNIGSETERARIDSSGNLLVGTTSTSTPTSSTADVYLGGIVMPPSRRTTGNAANVNIDPTSGIFARSTSSLKYKRDVQNAVHGLAEVMALRPVTYKGKSEADGDTVFGGLIAEEVHDAGLTEFVQYAGDGSPDSLAYGNMVSLAFKAIQELKAEVDALKAQLAG